MKLRYFFAAIAACSVLAVGCQESFEPLADLEEIQVSSAFVAIPTDGGTQTITVNAQDAWSFYTTDNAKDDYAIPSWLTITPMTGVAGETTVSFSADATVNTREANLKILIGDKTQYITVKQTDGTSGVTMSTCAEVLAGPDGKTYQVEGVCVQIAESATYGNWYIDDGTGKVYIYGTKYDGQTKQGALIKYGIDVGDVITIEGPKTTYNGTVELVDVTVLNIKKSLVKVETASISAAKEGGEYEAKVIAKGDNLDVKADQDWIHISNIRTEKDTTIVTFYIHENVDEARTGSVTFSSSADGATSTGSLTVEQATGINGYKVPFEELFAANIGSFTTNDIVPVAGKTIWSQGTYNGSGYMKATSGSKVDCESDLVSPNIDLTGTTTATLTFEHAHKFAGNVYEELTLWASTDGGASWQQLLIPVYGTNNDWNFVPVTVSLNKFVGNIVNLAWKYKSNANAYATWEVAKVKVTADNAALSCVADINNAIASTSDSEFKATLKDAVVTYVNGGNAFIEDATGGIQLYLKNHGLTAGQVINGEISGKAKVYAGYTEMTGIDLSKATVTSGEVPAGVELTLAKLLAGYNRYINCKVVLKDVDITTGIAKDARDGVVKQGDAEVALRAQVNGVTMAAGKGTLVCWPTTYNGKKQLGAWADAHFTN